MVEGTHFLLGSEYAVLRREFLQHQRKGTEAPERAWRVAHQPYQRAHVMPYFYENAGLFRIASLRAGGEYGHHRWTLDTPEDLEMIRSVYKHFSPRGYFGWREVLSLLERRPDLFAINSHIRQKVLGEG